MSHPPLRHNRKVSLFWSAQTSPSRQALQEQHHFPINGAPTAPILSKDQLTSVQPRRRSPSPTLNKAIPQPILFWSRTPPLPFSVRQPISSLLILMSSSSVTQISKTPCGFNSANP